MLEVGMYVKMNPAIFMGITKIIKVDKSKITVEDKNFIYGRNFETGDISKVSNNLIDLIEEGDFIKTDNGIIIVQSIERNYPNDPYEDKYIIGNDNLIYHESNIKKTLTKEQFEANSYKVGGNE